MKIPLRCCKWQWCTHDFICSRKRLYQSLRGLRYNKIGNETFPGTRGYARERGVEEPTLSAPKTSKPAVTTKKSANAQEVLQLTFSTCSMSRKECLLYNDWLHFFVLVSKQWIKSLVPSWYSSNTNGRRLYLSYVMAYVVVKVNLIFGIPGAYHVILWTGLKETLPM